MVEEHISNQIKVVVIHVMQVLILTILKMGAIIVDKDIIAQEEKTVGNVLKIILHTEKLALQYLTVIVQ